MISHNQSIDNILLSQQKAFQPNRTKMAELWPKKVCPCMEIIDILRSILTFNLAKYQYFSVGPGLFDKYLQKNSLCNFHFNIIQNVDFMSKKPRISAKFLKKFRQKVLEA